MLLAVMLFAEPLNLLAEEMPAETGILTEGTTAETGIPAEEMSAETGIPAEETPAETGALQDQMLYFVNLYWETENLGEIEAVFDDGIQETEPVIQRMTAGERGSYEITVPEGKYSSVAFQSGEKEIWFTETAYDFEELERMGWDTFYYDPGENPSYWGSSPFNEPVETVQYQVEGADPGSVVVTPGDMVYFVDMNKVEYPDASELYAADRINIAFLKNPHKPELNFDPSKGETDGELYTMYERRDGIYSAPFPGDEQVLSQYSEIAFQFVKNGDLDSESKMLNYHYNFRGEKDSGSQDSGQGMKWGYFEYKRNYMDTFYYNFSQEDSFWGVHPGAEDSSLDTQIMYVDTTDYTGNGIVVDVENMWLGWKGITADMFPGEEYVEGKGIRLTDQIMREGFRYFQFPYNSGATENTILTLTFRKKAVNGSLGGEETKEYTYKFTLVPRSGRNCLQIDHIWEFNGQLWTGFEIGNLEKRDIFYRNKKTGYQEILMRPAWEDGTYLNRNELLFNFQWSEEEAAGKITEVPDAAGNPTWWIQMEPAAESGTYDSTGLYYMEIPSLVKKVQFRGKKGEVYYYSNQELISQKLSYPCYFAAHQGGGSNVLPDAETDNPGITGFWRSVYSTDTSGDESVDIPEDRFSRETTAFYGNATFYDYYSNWEMDGRKITEYERERYEEDLYRGQGSTFNTAAEKYYQNIVRNEWKWPSEKEKEFQALYLASKYHKNYWQGGGAANEWTGKEGGPVSGLAGKELQNGKIVTGQGAEMPFFREDFLRGNNAMETAVGNVYKNVLFPFTKDTTKTSRTYGYWVFNSANQSDAMRLSYDGGKGYFLKRTGEPIQYGTGPNALNAFFPFTSQKDVGPRIENRDPGKYKINLMFGTRLNMDFTLTDSAEVYNEYTEKEEPIRFEFQGDDDAWIYVDGYLALDLGGIHDAVRGEIDFKNGTYTIWKGIKAQDGSYDGDGTQAEKGTLPEALVTRLQEKGAVHTLTMFYMERGLEESNLKLSFNFPRKSTFTVEKEVDITTNQQPGENLFADLLKNMGGFKFLLKNLVTSGETLAVEDSAGYIKPGEAKPLTGAGTRIKIAENAGSVAALNDSGPWKVKQNSSVFGMKPEQEKLLQITPERPVDASEMSYVRLEVTNEGINDTSARNLYLSFLDANGKRTGGYANTLGYEGESCSFLRQEKTILRIDYRQMSGDMDFDWSKVSKMLLGVRADIGDATAYTISSVEFVKAVNQVPLSGFGVNDEQISDYGSYAGGTLTNVDKAWYIRKTETGENSYDFGLSRQTDNGEFALANGQKAVFTDKFRTGSYLALEEVNVDQAVFDTEWTIREYGKEIPGKYLLKTRDDAESVQNPLERLTEQSLLPLENQKGTEIKDGRTENIRENSANAERIQLPENKNTIVYRSYADPDISANVVTDLSVSVKNILKYGSLTIEKRLANRDGPGDYLFDIYYVNVAGMGLESQLAPVVGNQRYVRQTVTVHVNASGTGSVTVPNIPAGTQYYIVERPTNGTKLVGIDLGEKDKDNPHTVEIEGVRTGTTGTPDDYSGVYVKGVAYASNQIISFTNEKEDFYLTIEKVWRDGLTEEERKAQGISEIYVALQRRVYTENQDTEWINVTDRYFKNTVSLPTESGNYLRLSAENQWKQNAAEIIEIRTAEGGLYEYRIQERDPGGVLKNYEVSYDAVRNPDVEEADGKRRLSVNYQAVNTTVGIVIRKIWEDNGDIAGMRPSRIRVKLMGSSDWNPGKVDQVIHWQCYKALADPDHVCNDQCYFELTSGNAWKQSVRALTISDKDGKTYSYKLAGEELYCGKDAAGREIWKPAEQKPGNQMKPDNRGYQVTYSTPVIPESNQSVTISITNRLPVGHVTVSKKDSETKAYLENAEFQIERLVPEENVENSKLEIDPQFNKRQGVTSATGEIKFQNLPYGIYKITETKAPKGYLLKKTPEYVTVNGQTAQTVTITIYNEKGMVLPVTGGRGILKFAVSGIILIWTGVFLYQGRKEKRRKRKRKEKRKQRWR